MNQFSRALGVFFQQHDLYLTPTLWLTRPIRHGLKYCWSGAGTLQWLLATGLLPLLARWGAMDNMVEHGAWNLTYVPATGESDRHASNERLLCWRRVFISVNSRAVSQ
jgi:amidase